MFKRIFVAALVFGAAAAAPPAAEAQILCGPRDKMVERLEATFGETQKGFGLKGGAALYELWTSEGGSWTLLVTRPDGLSCMLADGTHWRETGHTGTVTGQPS